MTFTFKLEQADGTPAAPDAPDSNESLQAGGS